MDTLFCGQFSHHPGIADLCHPSQLFELLSPQTGRHPCRGSADLGASVHSLTLPLPPPDFTRMQDIPEETESRDGEPVASET